MVVYEPIPQVIIDKRSLWGSERDKFLAKVNKEEEYYYNDVEGTGTNFTIKQLARIEEGSQIPVTINFLHPVCNQKLAILTQTKPTFKIVGLDDRGKNYASVLDKAVHSIMYKSEAVGEEEETIKNMLILGMGISGITETETHQFGTFGVEYENIHPSMVILDINARKRSLKDMSGYFHEKEITKIEAQRKFQVIFDEINRQNLGEGKIVNADSFCQTGISTPVQGVAKLFSSGFFDTVLLSEFYDKVYTTKYFIEDIDSGGVKQMFAENFDNEEQKFVLQNPLDTEKNYFVRRTIMLGDKVIALQIQPIKDFAIKVKFFEWGGRPYKSYGMIHFTKGMQETYDKSIQGMLLNGMLTNNTGYTSPIGAITPTDRPKWEAQGARPGVIKEYNPVVSGGVMLKPERESIQQLSNFYPIITEMMRNGIYESTGINPMVSGNPQEGKIDVFASLQQYQNAAMQRVLLAMSHINLANEQLGNVCLDLLISSLNSEESYFFFDETNALNEIKIIKDLMKDFKLGRYGVLSIAAEAMPTQKLSMAAELMKISQTTQDQIERSVYIKKAFSLSDMRGFDEVQGEIDTARKLAGQVQQLSDELKRQIEITKQFENKALQAEYQVKLMNMIQASADAVTTAQAKVEKDLQIDKLTEQLKEAKKPAMEQ